MYNFSADIHGIKVYIESNNDRFMYFVESGLSYFSTICSKNESTVSVKFDYCEFMSKKADDFPFDKKNMDMKKIGPGIYVNDNWLIWNTREGIELAFEALNGGSKLVVYSRYQETRNVAKHKFNFYPSFHRICGLLKFRNKSKGVNDNFYNTIMQKAMRYSIYFPVFWLLKKKRGIILLHGGAVEKDEKTLVFIGLNQVGKSFLTAYFSNNGYKFLSDNFLLVDSEGIFAFPDTIRLEQESFIHEHIDNSILKKTDIRIGREQYFVFSDSNVTRYAKPSVIFLLSASNKTEIKGMSIEDAMNKIFSINLLVPEFIDYSYINLLHWILPQEESIFAKEVEILHSFLSNAYLYELSVNHEDNIKNVCEKVIQKCI